MSKSLPDTFKAVIPASLLKSLEYEFHSVNYLLMMQVLTALRTVIDYLIKTLEESKDFGDLETQTAPGFMLKLYNLSSQRDVLFEIGIKKSDVQDVHLRCLAELPLTATYSCLKLFFYWVNEGFYDFNTLPFPLKVHLGPQHKQAIEQLQTKFSTAAELLRELQQLVDVLKQSEQDITIHVNDSELVNVS